MPDAEPPLDAEGQARSTVVVERLRALAGVDGIVPFDRFMEVALYGRDVGFYERSRTPLGRSGDFYTAAHVTPLFARAIAQRIRAVRRALGDPVAFWVVDLGPGDGTLADGLLGALSEEPPGLEYVLVERASARAREAGERAGATSRRIPVRRADSIGALGPFTGVVVANEFLDAQPARRLHWHDGAWHEVGVRIRDGRVEFAESALERALPGRPLPTPEEASLTLEISPSAEASVREVADHLEEGLAIFLDYGAEEPELVRAHPGGTLAAVRGHRFRPDPLEAPGTLDLSTFVNFSRIRDAGHAAGLAEVAYRSQVEALGAWGFPALLDAALRESPTAEAKVRVQLAAKNLLFGFERFRALELAPPATAASLAD